MNDLLLLFGQAVAITFGAALGLLLFGLIGLGLLHLGADKSEKEEATPDPDPDLHWH